MRTLRIFLTVLGLLGLGDVLTTLYAVQHGGAEGNPLMRGVVHAGVLPMLGTEVAFLLVAYLICRKALRRGVCWGVYIPLLVCVLEKGYIVLHNVAVIRAL